MRCGAPAEAAPTSPAAPRGGYPLAVKAVLGSGVPASRTEGVGASGDVGAVSTGVGGFYGLQIKAAERAKVALNNADRPEPSSHAGAAASARSRWRRHSMLQGGRRH